MVEAMARGPLVVPSEHPFVNYESHARKRPTLSCEQKRMIQTFVSINHRRRAKKIILPIDGPILWRKRKSRTIAEEAPSEANGTREDLLQSDDESITSMISTSMVKAPLQHGPCIQWPIEYEDRLTLALEYFTKAWAPAKGVFFGDKLIYCKEIYPLAMSDSALFYSLVAMSGAGLRTLRNIATPSKELLYCCGQALTMLRSKLQKASADNFATVSPAERDVMMWTAIMLIGADSFSRDQNSIKHHLTGISQLGTLCGGPAKGSLLQVLTTYLRGVRATLDSTSTRYEIHEPGTDDCDLFELSLSSREPDQGVFEATFSKFAESGHSMTNRTLHYYESSGSSRRGSPEQNAFQCFTDWSNHPGSIDECLYSAMLLYKLTGRYRLSRHPATTNLLLVLSNAVMQFQGADWREIECMIWMLTVAGSGSRHTKTWARSFNFIGFMLDRYPRTRDYEYWHFTVKKFVFTQSLLHEWEDAWRREMKRALDGIGVKSETTDESTPLPKLKALRLYLDIYDQLRPRTESSMYRDSIETPPSLTAIVADYFRCGPVAPNHT